jgi:hypothetical protein
MVILFVDEEEKQKQEGCYRFSGNVGENLWPQNRF